MSLWYHKIDSYQWIHGSIREDLEPDERSVWADLIALAGLTREERRGYIERSEGVPYRKHQIINLLNITEELYDRALQKCISEGRVVFYDDGTIYLKNWDKYNDVEDWREKKRRKAISNAKSNGNKSLRDASVDNLAHKVNTLNALLRSEIYKIKDGVVVDVKTGEVATEEVIDKIMNNGSKQHENSRGII